MKRQLIVLVVLTRETFLSVLKKSKAAEANPAHDRQQVEKPPFQQHWPFGLASTRLVSF